MTRRGLLTMALGLVGVGCAYVGVIFSMFFFDPNFAPFAPVEHRQLRDLLAAIVGWACAIGFWTAAVCRLVRHRRAHRFE